MIKEGDNVAVRSHGSFYKMPPKKMAVERVTPSGRIVIGGCQFEKTRTETYAERGGRRSATLWKAEDQEEVDRDVQIKRVSSFVGELERYRSPSRIDSVSDLDAFEGALKAALEVAK